MPEFYDICPKNARILYDNCPKNIFPILWGGGMPPVCPPSPTPTKLFEITGAERIAGCIVYDPFVIQPTV